MFFSDDDAVVGQPISLLIAAFVAAVIIAIFLVSLVTMTLESQTHMVEHQIDKIISQSTTMFEYAKEGAFSSVHVDFPSSMRFIVFGGLPKNNTEQPTNLSENDLMSNSYYYVMVDGSIHTGHSNVRFSARNSSQVALFHPGSYYLDLELVIEGEKTYVKIY
jgi:archaellum component FlaG (FlaF/FlaG flagellin family)